MALCVCGAQSGVLCERSRLLLRPHRLHDPFHLRALLLAALVRAQALLGKLESALEGRGGADLEQLEQAALVRREADSLTNNLLHDLAALRQLPLALSLLRLARAHR